MTPEQIRIKASNEKWLNRKKPLHSTPHYRIKQAIQTLRISTLNDVRDKKH